MASSAKNSTTSSNPKKELPLMAKLFIINKSNATLRYVRHHYEPGRCFNEEWPKEISAEHGAVLMNCHYQDGINSEYGTDFVMKGYVVYALKKHTIAIGFHLRSKGYLELGIDLASRDTTKGKPDDAARVLGSLSHSLEPWDGLVEDTADVNDKYTIRMCCCPYGVNTDIYEPSSVTFLTGDVVC